MYNISIAFKRGEIMLKDKKVLTIVAVILSVIILAVAGFFISKLIVVPQDINTINGCPEFYDIEFGMTLSQASKNIKLEHKTIEGIEGNSLFEVDDFMKEDKKHEKVFGNNSFCSNDTHDPCIMWRFYSCKHSFFC